VGVHRLYQNRGEGKSGMEKPGERVLRVPEARALRVVRSRGGSEWEEGDLGKGDSITSLR